MLRLLFAGAIVLSLGGAGNASSLSIAVLPLTLSGRIPPPGQASLSQFGCRSDRITHFTVAELVLARKKIAIPVSS